MKRKYRKRIIVELLIISCLAVCYIIYRFWSIIVTLPLALRVLLTILALISGGSTLFVLLDWGFLILTGRSIKDRIREWHKSATPDYYFEEIDFGKPDENTIQKAIDGILNTEKVAPFFVHAAPKCKEVEIIKSRLEKTGFAMVSGGPGEGKSMAAYHAAYKFQNKDGYRVYELRTERLENKTWKDICDDLLFELGRLKGRKKLIIVDDAHKLAIKRDLTETLQRGAKEGCDKCIIIETEFYEEEQGEIPSDENIRVDFEEFWGELLKNFYQNQDPILQKALKGRVKGLQNAIDMVIEGKIRDAFHLAFVASQGEERLAQETKTLSNLELLVLFLISSHVVLSGEKGELSDNDLVSRLNALKFGWLPEALRHSTFSDTIRSLQERTQYHRPMIRIYDKSESDRGYITSFHYDFARAVIRASLLRTKLTEDLLHSIGGLLKSEYYKCVYIGVFLRDIGVDATVFARENKDWLINFVNNLLPEFLGCYPPLLSVIKRVAKDIYNEIIKNLNIPVIAEKINNVEAGQFGKLAYLWDAIGNRRNELIGKLDLAQLSEKANGAEVGQFSQLADFLGAIGARRDELIKELNLAQLSEKANGAEVGQFDQLACLLDAIGSRRDEMIEKLNLVALAKVANSTNVGKFGEIAKLMIALGDNRSKLIEKMNLKLLGKTCCSDVKVKQFKSLAQVLRELEECRNELIKELDFEKLAKVANAAEINEFEQISELLKELGESKSQLSKLLDHNTLIQKAGQASPYDIMGLTRLMAGLEEEDRDKYVREINWSSICLKCLIYAPLLGALGASLENLWKQAEISPNRDNIERVTQHLQAHYAEIEEEIGKVPPKVYSGVAKFLCGCNKFNPTLAKQIATETMDKLVETFKIEPTEYQGTGRLINALYAIDPNLSVSFVENNKIQGRIRRSVNLDNWSKEVEGLKHLIESWYRSAPKLWKRIIRYNWLTADLSSLDLDSIYDKVDKEKIAGTACDTV